MGGAGFPTSNTRIGMYPTSISLGDLTTFGVNVSIQYLILVLGTMNIEFSGAVAKFI